MVKTIFFKYVNDEYGCLSNFSNHPIKDDQGRIWGTTEAWYQAQKFPDHPDLQEQIRLKPSPKAAKVLAQLYPEKVRKDWHEVSIETMEEALRLKLKYHANIAIKLLESGEAKLVERSDKDPFWGDGKDGQGRNELGKAWMRLRQEIIDAPTPGYAGREEFGGSDF